MAKLHLILDAVDNAEPGGRRFEESTPVFEIVSPERDLPVDAEAGQGERALTDVHGMDPKRLGRNRGVEERHRHRVRLFAGRTGQTQYPDDAIGRAGAEASLSSTTRESAVNASGSRKNHVSGTTTSSTSACSSASDLRTQFQ